MVSDCVKLAKIMRIYQNHPYMSTNQIMWNIVETREYSENENFAK